MPDQLAITFLLGALDLRQTARSRIVCLAVLSFCLHCHPCQLWRTATRKLVFPAGSDPFGGIWEEEEVVIDRYASLESQAVSHRPRVKSEEGREIGQLGRIGRHRADQGRRSHDDRRPLRP